MKSKFLRVMGLKNGCGGEASKDRWSNKDKDGKSVEAWWGWNDDWQTTGWTLLTKFEVLYEPTIVSGVVRDVIDVNVAVKLLYEATIVACLLICYGCGVDVLLMCCGFVADMVLMYCWWCENRLMFDETWWMWLEVVEERRKEEEEREKMKIYSLRIRAQLCEAKLSFWLTHTPGDYWSQLLVVWHGLEQKKW
jgi:hypothetical protein